MLQLHKVNNVLFAGSALTPTTPLTPGSMSYAESLAASQKRRSSTRSIKRKKFDDELVESSLVKAERPKPKMTLEVKPVDGPSPTGPPPEKRKVV